MQAMVKDLARRMGIGRKKRKGLERAICGAIGMLRRQAYEFGISERMVLQIWAAGYSVPQVFNLARKQGAIGLGPVAK